MALWLRIWVYYSNRNIVLVFWLTYCFLFRLQYFKINIFLLLSCHKDLMFFISNFNGILMHILLILDR